jgi:hypothetical protein
MQRSEEYALDRFKAGLEAARSVSGAARRHIEEHPFRFNPETANALLRGDRLRPDSFVRRMPDHPGSLQLKIGPYLLNAFKKLDTNAAIREQQFHGLFAGGKAQLAIQDLDHRLYWRLITWNAARQYAFCDEEERERELMPWVRVLKSHSPEAFPVADLDTLLELADHWKRRLCSAKASLFGLAADELADTKRELHRELGRIEAQRPWVSSKPGLHRRNCDSPPSTARGRQKDPGNPSSGVRGNPRSP